MAYHRPHHEHSLAVHHDDRDRVFFLRTDRYPFYCQHSDGTKTHPEDIFTLGEYLGREQYGTRPLFYGPAFLFESGTRRKRRLLYSAPVGSRKQVCPQGKDFSRRKRLLYRTSRTCGIRICTEYVFPAYVQLVTRTTLQAMGRHQRTRRSLRPVWRNGNGEHA